MAKKRKPKTHRMRASMRESPYDVLGVSPSSNSQQIKRAYRKLALKYHPDVNKEKDAEEKFMRIKHAYNTLMSPKGKRENYPNTRTQGNQSWRAREEEEEFYGFGDFFRDLQVEYENWESSANSQERPKSLWEELSDIGEEFVEFLEKELNIADKDPGNDNGKSPPKNNSYEYYRKNKRKGEDEDEDEKRNINDNIDDVEAALAKLKKELGL
ncbi:Chaperone protein DnaJ [Zostera marina]|uniref:Chaperone protein DnaJ n=1 Tax=Zostera marina TaxID=29655 RepID=A0A0K9PFJ3_ZOSMR|nr:Chaperone protein DnaJ [Zostera marina]